MIWSELRPRERRQSGFGRLMPFAQWRRPGEVIRQFTPNWFAVTMGTGILALALPQLPGVGPALHGTGRVLWLLNVGLFGLFSCLYAAQWIRYGREARRIFAHAVMSMFLGTIPMGLATIINGIVTFAAHGPQGMALSVAHALWWLDAFMAIACGVLIPYQMFTRQGHALEQMTALWLLPVVAAEVSAASGGVLAAHLPDSGAAFVMLIASYALWAYSVPLAFAILVILILRLSLHGLPHESMAASIFLTLGPIGTAALALLACGEAAPAILSARGLDAVGVAAHGIGVIGAVAFWGFGLWWLLLALLVTRRYFKAAPPFNLGWWGYTFPLGVYAVATLKLGVVLNSAFYAAFGSCLVAMLALAWVVVALRTAAGSWKGTLFPPPCIAAVGGPGVRPER